jgi:hypothetical protein
MGGIESSEAALPLLGAVLMVFALKPRGRWQSTVGGTA